MRLNNMATKDEIIKAYRNKANLHHPDKNAGSMDAERQFNEISRAYKILLECPMGMLICLMKRTGAITTQRLMKII